MRNFLCSIKYKSVVMAEEGCVLVSWVADKATEVGSSGILKTLDLISFHLCFFLSKLLFPFLGLPRWPRGEESTSQCRRHRRQGLDPWVGKIPLSRKWITQNQYACLENSREGAEKWAEKAGVLQFMWSQKSQTWLSMHSFPFLPPNLNQSWQDSLPRN